MSTLPPSDTSETPEQESPQFEIELHLRFVKLTNGEDIICQVIEGVGHDQLNLMVCHPIKVVEMENMESAYGLLPWIPFTRQQVIVINRLTVITITTVMESVEEMYIRHLKDYLTESELEDAVTPEVPKFDQELLKSKTPCTHKKWIN